MTPKYTRLELEAMNHDRAALQAAKAKYVTEDYQHRAASEIEAIPGYAGCAVTFEDMRPMAETAARIALLEADNARLRREAAEWTEMLARDGITFDEQPVMDPVPPLYFWLGKDAPA